MKEKVKMYYHMQKYAFLMPSMFFFFYKKYIGFKNYQFVKS